MVPQGMDVLLRLTVAVLRGFQSSVRVHMLPCGSQGHLSISRALQLCNFNEYMLVSEALESISIGSEKLRFEKWINHLLFSQSRFLSSC